MFSWFDVAYAFLNISMMFYCFKNYFVSKKRPFQLMGLGFTCLLISDQVWVFAFIPWLASVLPLYGYIRLGLYAVFILLILQSLQLFKSNPQASTK